MNDLQKEASDIITKLCKGDLNAVSFCELYLKTAHMIDDLYDGDIPKEKIVDFTQYILDLISHEFFRVNYSTLYPVLQLTLLTWSVSNLLDKSTVDKEREIGDMTRICGNDLILVVALMFTPLAECIEPCARLKVISYQLHHTKDNQPI